MKLLLATQNKGKLQEVRTILAGHSIELVSLNDVGHHSLEIDETGTTYDENARIKARTVASLTGLPTIADDSGLEVAALNGRPGLKSARYAKGSDKDRYEKLLKEMEGKEDRAAKFVAVIAYVNPLTKEDMVFRGECPGILLEAPRGEHGFGYDPIFMPQGHHESMAELGDSIKNEISHRARALQAFLRWWQEKE